MSRHRTPLVGKIPLGKASRVSVVLGARPAEEEVIHSGVAKEASETFSRSLRRCLAVEAKVNVVAAAEAIIMCRELVAAISLSTLRLISLMLLMEPPKRFSTRELTLVQRAKAQVPSLELSPQPVAHARARAS